MKSKLLLIPYCLLLFACKSENVSSNQTQFVSECNISDPKKDLSWIEKYSAFSFGYYLYIYYGTLQKGDSKYLDNKNYFLNYKEREIVIFRIGLENKISENINKNDSFFLFKCNGDRIDKDDIIVDEDWLLILTKLRNKVAFDAKKL